MQWDGKYEQVARGRTDEQADRQAGVQEAMVLDRCRDQPGRQVSVGINRGEMGLGGPEP